MFKKSKFMRFFYCFLFIFIYNFSLYSTCTTVGDGKWWVVGTWSCSPESAPPGCTDSIFISTGDSIYIDAQVDLIACGPIVVVVYGILQFKTGTKMKLASGSELIIKPGGKINPGSGGGNSNYLEIGGNEVWTAGDGPQSGPLTYTEAGPLPIKLVSFEANANENKVDLKWITATEINNDFFTIEKSKDLRYWEIVSNVSGAGNSNINIEYFEVDYSPYDGVSYYRLKQTDFDGNFEYFNIVPVKVDLLNEGEMNLFPNPLRRGQELKINLIEIKEDVLIVIRDAKGQEFYSKAEIHAEGNQLIAIPFDNSIPSGLYIVTASSENQIYSQKLMIK